MKISSMPAYKIIVSLVLILTVSSMVGCNASVPIPTPTMTKTATNTATAIPTMTPSATVTPLPTATSTPDDLKLLDQRTQMLFGDPASTVIDFFLEIQDSVRNDDKEKLAGLTHYPITIHSIDGKDVEIKTEKQFIANYEKIVTPKWKGVILAQEPAKLFTKSEGIMVNRGELWFGPICLDGPACQKTQYYIYSITNDTPW
jgi:hypothetical protein